VTFIVSEYHDVEVEAKDHEEAIEKTGGIK